MAVSMEATRVNPREDTLRSSILKYGSSTFLFSLLRPGYASRDASSTYLLSSKRIRFIDDTRKNIHLTTLAPLLACIFLDCQFPRSILHCFSLRLYRARMIVLLIATLLKALCETLTICYSSLLQITRHSAVVDEIGDSEGASARRKGFLSVRSRVPATRRRA